VGISIYKAKLTIGCVLMAAHFGSIGLLIYGYSVIGFDALVSSILILTPLTVTYVTLFLKDLTRIQFIDDTTTTRLIRPSAFVIQLTFIVLFAACLFMTIGVYVSQGTMTEAQFKVVLGIIESAVGVFVGTITSVLFDGK
jgi:hypothetical protein